MLKLLLSSVLCMAAPTLALGAPVPDIAEFANGQTTKFSTTGHAKAKGLKMTISYPNSWAAKEADGPNIVQKFVGSSNKGVQTVMIQTKSLPGGTKPTDEDAKDALSESSLKELLPNGATFISARPTRIADRPAGILEFSVHRETRGIVIELHCVSYTFFSGSTMVQVQCQVGGAQGIAKASKEQMEEFRPLFTQVANSISFPEK